MCTTVFKTATTNMVLKFTKLNPSAKSRCSDVKHLVIPRDPFEYITVACQSEETQSQEAHHSAPDLSSQPALSTRRVI